MGRSHNLHLDISKINVIAMRVQFQESSLASPHAFQLIAGPKLLLYKERNSKAVISYT